MSKTIEELEALVERAEFEAEAAGRATDGAYTDAMALADIKLRALRTMLRNARQQSGNGE